MPNHDIILRININAIPVKVFHLSHVDYLILYIRIVRML